VEAFDVGAVEAGIAGTQFVGEVLHFALTGSTNALALEAAQAGATSGVWVADEQTAGRGRGGHGWHSAAGDGLYVSALVTPELAMERAMWLPLVTGLAVQAAVLAVTGLAVDIRWPNDLMLGGKKCGGILVESAAGAVSSASAGGGEVAMLRYAVIGVGVNVNHAGFPEELAGLATSLRMVGGAAVSRELLLAALLRALDAEVASLALPGAGVLERFAAVSSWVQGKRVRVGEAGGYTGVTAGLDARGFLRVAGDDGVLHTVLSGGVREI